MASLEHAARAPLGRLIVSSVHVRYGLVVHGVRIIPSRDGYHGQVAALGVDRVSAAEDAFAAAVGRRASRTVYVQSAEGGAQREQRMCEQIRAMPMGLPVGPVAPGTGWGGGAVDGALTGLSSDSPLTSISA